MKFYKILSTLRMNKVCTGHNREGGVSLAFT